MRKLLHIIATPREEESRTLLVSDAFLEVVRQAHSDWVIDELELAKEDLPQLTSRRVDGKYTLLSGGELFGTQKEQWQEIIAHIERFLSADVYLITTPMWNFSIPYNLKQYIDIIMQPRFLFRYTKTGVEGLVKGKKMFVVTSRGGDYRSPEMKKLDFQEPYLRAVFGFAGIEDITFIIAQPMDMGDKLREEKIGEAQRQAQESAGQL